MSDIDYCKGDYIVPKQGSKVINNIYKVIEVGKISAFNDNLVLCTDIKKGTEHLFSKYDMKKANGAEILYKRRQNNEL